MKFKSDRKCSAISPSVGSETFLCYGDDAGCYDYGDDGDGNYDYDDVDYDDNNNDDCDNDYDDGDDDDYDNSDDEDDDDYDNGNDDDDDCDEGDDEDGVSFLRCIVDREPTPYGRRFNTLSNTL